MCDCLTKIKNILKENEAALIISPSARLYLSGFHSSDGYVLITKNKTMLFADFRYFEAATKAADNVQVVLFEGVNSIKNHLNNINKIFIEPEFLSVFSFNKLKKDLGASISKSNKISNIIIKSRMVKTKSELDSIKKAQQICDAAFQYILTKIKVGKTEQEIMLDLEFFTRKQGSEGVAFDFIVVSGKNSSLPHGEPSNKKIEKGDFVTLDFGAVINGYRSDMTRTVAVGDVTAEQIKVYNTVLAAQKAALAKIKAGAVCSSIDKTARDIIENAGYKGCFGHALGHSVGLNIHELPNFSPKCNTKLKENMVLTVEPGIYINNKFGVRIEDMVIVKKGGCENITNSPKELIVLPAEECYN